MTTQRAASTQWASAVLAQASADPGLADAMLAHGLDVKASSGAEALIGAVVMERTAVVASLLRAGVPPTARARAPGRRRWPTPFRHAI